MTNALLISNTHLVLCPTLSDQTKQANKTKREAMFAVWYITSPTLTDSIH